MYDHLGTHGSHSLTESREYREYVIIHSPHEENIKLKDISNKCDEKAMLKHEVKKDDTLQGLAVKYGVNVESLKTVNKLHTENVICLHKVLKIPGVYDLKEAETCFTEVNKETDIDDGGNEFNGEFKEEVRSEINFCTDDAEMNTDADEEEYRRYFRQVFSRIDRQIEEVCKNLHYRSDDEMYIEKNRHKQSNDEEKFFPSFDIEMKTFCKDVGNDKPYRNIQITKEYPSVTTTI